MWTGTYVDQWSEWAVGYMAEDIPVHVVRMACDRDENNNELRPVHRTKVTSKPCDKSRWMRVSPACSTSREH
nr:hypothetical protein BgiMline_023648 [Biomphalaria glabrata]